MVANNSLSKVLYLISTDCSFLIKEVGSGTPHSSNVLLKHCSHYVGGISGWLGAMKKSGSGKNFFAGIESCGRIFIPHQSCSLVLGTRQKGMEELQYLSTSW